MSAADLSASVSPVQRRGDWAVVAAAYLAFIVLGAAFAMLGALWDPHLRAAFGMPLDGNAPLFLLNGFAYFLASFITGRLAARFSPFALMAACMALFVAGLAGQMATPSWIGFVLAAFVMNLGGGLMDATVNIVFAARFDQRLMNWLHASFGMGALLAPLLANAILGMRGTWQNVYGVLVLAVLAVSVLIVLTRALWHLPQAAGDHSGGPATRLRATLALPLVWIGIATFLVYGGLEATGGNWLQTLFMNGHAQSEETARSWLSIFWISFTLGRIFWGFFATRIAPMRLTSISILGAVAGGVLLMLNPLPQAGWLGAAVGAFMVGPLFAVAIALTQTQLGPAHAPNAIGIQIASTNIGIAFIPGIVGALTAASSPAVIAASMALLPALMFGLHLLRAYRVRGS